MQTIEAKVQVKADRMVTVQLPVDVQMGEYDVVLVLNSSSAQAVRQSSIQAAQDLLRQFIPAGRSLSNELIQERREEDSNE
jgi:hypothetical protein